MFKKVEEGCHVCVHVKALCAFGASVVVMHIGGGVMLVERE